jgi:hypothetical protein
MFCVASRLLGRHSGGRHSRTLGVYTAGAPSFFYAALFFFIKSFACRKAKKIKGQGSFALKKLKACIIKLFI